MDCHGVDRQQDAEREGGGLPLPRAWSPRGQEAQHPCPSSWLSGRQGTSYVHCTLTAQGRIPLWGQRGLGFVTLSPQPKGPVYFLCRDGETEAGKERQRVQHLPHRRPKDPVQTPPSGPGFFPSSVLCTARAPPPPASLACGLEEQRRGLRAVLSPGHLPPALWPPGLWRSALSAQPINCRKALRHSQATSTVSQQHCFITVLGDQAISQGLKTGLRASSQALSAWEWPLGTVAGHLISCKAPAWLSPSRMPARMVIMAQEKTQIETGKRTALWPHTPRGSAQTWALTGRQGLCRLQV